MRNADWWRWSFSLRADWRKSDSSFNREPQGNWSWNSISRDVIASSPSFSRPAARTSRRTCSQATFFSGLGSFCRSMLLQNEGSVKFGVQTPYKKKPSDAINFESVTCYLGRPRWRRFAGTSRRSRIKGKKIFRCNIVRDLLFAFLKIS